MEHFLEGIAPFWKWYTNPNENSNKYKSSLLSELTKALTEHFLQGNIPLRRLLNSNPPTSVYVLMEICLQWSKQLGLNIVCKNILQKNLSKTVCCKFIYSFFSHLVTARKNIHCKCQNSLWNIFMTENIFFISQSNFSK